MKRLSMVLVVLFTAVSLFAGGKYCEQKAAAAKSVELTGTMSRADVGEKAVFHVANSDRSYTVCEKTKNAVLKGLSEANVEFDAVPEFLHRPCRQFLHTHQMESNQDRIRFHQSFS